MQLIKGSLRATHGCQKKAADAATQYLWVKKYKKQKEKQKEESMNILI